MAVLTIIFLSHLTLYSSSASNDPDKFAVCSLQTRIRVFNRLKDSITRKRAFKHYSFNIHIFLHKLVGIAFLLIPSFAFLPIVLSFGQFPQANKEVEPIVRNLHHCGMMSIAMGL